MKYKVALHESEEGFSVCAPGLPGCWSQGKTESEALANIEAAIQEYLGVVEELLEDAQIREIEVPGCGTASDGYRAPSSRQSTRPLSGCTGR